MSVFGWAVLRKFNRGASSGGLYFLIAPSFLIATKRRGFLTAMETPESDRRNGTKEHRLHARWGRREITIGPQAGKLGCCVEKMREEGGTVRPVMAELPAARDAF